MIGTKYLKWYDDCNMRFKNQDLAAFENEDLLEKYPHQVISSMFPEHNWLPWKFTNLPPNYWDDLVTQRNFLEHSSEQLKISELSEIS